MEERGVHSQDTSTRARKRSLGPNLQPPKQGLGVVIGLLTIVIGLPTIVVRSLRCPRDRGQLDNNKIALTPSDSARVRSGIDRVADHHSLHPSKLLVVVPFTARDIPALSDNLEQWKQVGPACDPRSRAHHLVDLWFYYNKASQNLPADFARYQATPVYQQLHQCFSRTKVTFANLTAEEDGYPVGVNLMFFRLVAGVTHVHELSPFYALFWMEPDVQPIKPHWLDGLVRASQTKDDFWMKGSIYLGDVFDGAVSQDWTWTGHINGNALYRLHQPEFTQFLKIVMDLEPPDHFWKPFDVSIWKALHDFPYFWHAYQRIAKHFVYADFIEHWGYTITKDEKVISSRNPRTFLMHGKGTSSGERVFQQKLKTGLSRVTWVGTIEAKAENISVFMRFQAIDVDYAIVAISSVALHMDGAFEIVVVVPDRDVSLFLQRLVPHMLSTSKIRVISEEPVVTGGAHSMQEAYTRSIADTYCHGKYVFQMRSDSVLVRKVLRRDLIFAGKPIMRYGSCADLPDHARLWREGTANALGDDARDLTHICVGTSERVISRDVYRSLRSHIERMHDTSFRSFIQTRAGHRFCLLNNGMGDCQSTHNQAQKRRLAYSHTIVLGAYMFTRMKDAATWLPLEGSRDYAQQTFVPIITRFTCHGNAWLAHKLGQTRDDIQGLDSATHSGNCDSVKKWRHAWKLSLALA